MFLKEINLKGFKSFPDRTRLTFSPGVSVIVGPNGCGKSNITDAVLWALGEQSPTAVRGQSMQDVIFAGGKGQTRRRFAEVEVVIDNSEGRASSEFSEISVLRRIERNGDGEYRLNGARCRLADVVEALSDTNLGREMHSVISQGRVEAIVGSKPKDRRLLIEEAAGLGKHRKRRRRAQLKLERTRDNLDRALDVEREARSRLRPLKAQAEAAERQAKFARQQDELRARLVASDLRDHEQRLAAAEAGLTDARGRREAVEAQLEEIRKRRAAIEERIAAGERGSRLRAERLAEARAAVERVRARAEAIAQAERELRSALDERQLRLDELGGELEIEGDTTARIAELESELEQLGAGSAAEGLEGVNQAAAEAEGRRAEAEAALPALLEAAEEAKSAHARALALRDQARAEAAKATARRAALAGDLAAVEARLARAALEEGDEVLAGMIEAALGLERAVSAALGERLRASVVDSIPEGVDRLERAKGAARALISQGPAREQTVAPPVEGARRLLDLIEVDEPARPVAERLLADAWLVDEISAVPESFAGIAVTVDGERYDGTAGELRRIPREGTDPALAARSEREELAARLAERERTEQRAINELRGAEQALDAATQERDRTEAAVRAARRRLDEAAEEASRAKWLAEKRAAAPDAEGPMAVRRAELEAELGAERRHAEAAKRAREARDRDRARLKTRIELERDTLPSLGRLRAALESVVGRLERRVEAFAEPADQAGEDVAAELRECSTQEAGIQVELRAASESSTTGEVEAAGLRTRRDEAAAELARLAQSLEQELEQAEETLSEEERSEIETKLDRLSRKREQIGPVNPLAEREYAEARDHVKDISEQRQDLEKALEELKSLIRRTDREISAAFEETFEATAANFEEMVAELFPGGRGRLRRVELKPGGEAAEAAEVAAEEAPADDSEDGEGPPDETGVEIEVTPAGKSMRRLSLLSGGEKSLVALAFVFAVLMARPCPFYILDEVEAALDDLNLDRFLRLVRRFAERSQFVIVTHQKRTMDAADVLYGVSMGGDGITKVVSRKLPAAVEEEPTEHDAAVAAADAWSSPPSSGDVEAA